MAFEKLRSQFLDTLNGLFVKRDDSTGEFMDVKTTGGKFKSVRVEKKKRVVKKAHKAAPKKAAKRRVVKKTKSHKRRK